MDIPEKITEITGITNEDVKDSRPFVEVSFAISSIISASSAVIGYNPFFDKRMLAAEFNRADTAVTWPTMICAKRIWDIHEPKHSRHLQNAFKRFVSKEGFEGAHGALQDTQAARKVFMAQLEEFNLTATNWKDLDPEQTTWWGPTDHVIWKNDILVFNVGKNKGIPCHEIDKGFWNWLTTKDFPEHVNTLADYLRVVKPGISGEDLASWAYGRNP